MSVVIVSWILILRSLASPGRRPETIPVAGRGPGQKGPHAGYKEHSRQDQAHEAKQQLAAGQGKLGRQAERDGRHSPEQARPGGRRLAACLLRLGV